MRLVLVVAAWAAVLAGCGGGGSKTAATTTTPPTAAATTTTVPGPSVDVQPPSGPVGTSFQLTASRFQPTETVIFEIDFPTGKVFKGQAHKATADGTVTAPYRVTTGNPAGTYQVKATGDKGSQATGQFVVTSGSTVTTVAGHTATTVHTATTSHSTTTKKP